MAGLIRYGTADVVVDTQKIATSTWSNNTNNLTTTHTSSTQAVYTTATSSGAFYIDVYNLPTSSDSSSVQFAGVYGHKAGSGSLNFTNDSGSLGVSPSKVIYKQYQQLVFGDEESRFNFNDYEPDDIYVINISRQNYKHNLKPGTLNLHLSSSKSGSDTSSADVVSKLKLTDDSVTTTGSAKVTNAGRQFNIVSGSSGERSGSNLTQIDGSGSYGFFYPDSGFIILNGAALSESIGIGDLGTYGVVTGSNSSPVGHRALVQAISGGKHFIIDSEEKVTSQYYFTRARNTEFNYTTNPSFIDTDGNLNFTSMVDNPKTFITTVGLYNDMGDLVAVAKLSQPVSKDFTKEALIRVKLDY